MTTVKKLNKIVFAHTALKSLVCNVSCPSKSVFFSFPYDKHICICLNILFIFLFLRQLLDFFFRDALQC